MEDSHTVTRGGSHRGRTVGATAGLLAAGLVAGGILAGTLGASAATTDTTTTPSAAASSGSGSTGTTPAQPPANPKSLTPVRSDEKSVSSDLAAQLTTKAQAAVAGGAVYRVETDAGDAAYEAHMTKSDGTMVTVKFDKNLNVIVVEDGMGKGDPAPAGGPNGGQHDGPQGGSTA